MGWYNDYFLISLGKFKGRKKLAEYENNYRYMVQFMHFFDVAMQRYKITGLPDTIQERVVLESMIMYGCVVFFEHDGALLALPGAPGAGGLNINGDPVSANVFSRNGLLNLDIKLYTPGSLTDSELKKGADGMPVKSGRTGVIVWENKNRYPFFYTIDYYSRAIADTLRTIDVARMWLKVPFIPVCEQSLVDSVKVAMNQIQNNDEIVPMSTGVQDIKRFNILPVQESGESITAARELIDWYDQQFRSRCGIRANAAADKKGENLLDDEVHINDSYTDSISNNYVDYINEQLDFANNIFGTSIRCELNQSYQSEAAKLTEEEEEEVNNDNNDPE